MPRFRQHADAVAKRADFPAVDTGKVLRAHLDEVTDVLAADDRVILTGVGPDLGVDREESGLVTRRCSNVLTHEHSIPARP